MSAPVGRDAKCLAVFGRRGSGKSTLVKSLLRGVERVIVFDPMDEYAAEVPGFVRAESVSAALKIMARRWGGGFRIALVVPEDHAGQLHRLSGFLWRATEPYKAGRDRRKVWLVVEEMNLSVPSMALPKGQRGFERLILQGRHHGIELVGVSQRPALVSATFRGNAAVTYCFALAGHVDVQAVGQIVGPSHGGRLKTLPDHTYLKIENGAVSEGKNRLSRI